jgi:DNA polymerase III alpha subunit (gram-positive type)
MIIFSIDIETNGLAAGINSMISLGAAAIEVETGKVVSPFKINIKPVPDLQVDPNTMKWWEGFPEAYKAATDDAVDASVAMPLFVKWVKSFGIEKPVGAAWKPGFDMAFLRYYLYRFSDGDVFGRAGSGLDIKTATAIAMGQPFSAVQIGSVPEELKGDITNHSHDALEDAIEQGQLLVNVCEQLNWSPA